MKHKNKMPSEVETNNSWIPCKERNPDTDGEYLVTSEIYFTPDHVDEIDHYKGIEIRYYSVKYGWFGSKVYAWMPLPILYEGN